MLIDIEQELVILLRSVVRILASQKPWPNPRVELICKLVLPWFCSKITWMSVEPVMHLITLDEKIGNSKRVKNIDR